MNQSQTLCYFYVCGIATLAIALLGADASPSHQWTCHTPDIGSLSASGACYQPLLAGNVSSRIFTHPTTGKRYTVSQIGTWEEAQAQAEAMGGHLVIINNRDEQEWLVRTFYSEDSSGYLAGRFQSSPFAFWIGLTDRSVEGTFRWVDGSPLTYHNFAPGEPNNTSPEGWDEDFVALALDPNFNRIPGYWNDGNQIRGRARGIIELN
jgi:hypothetical protein